MADESKLTIILEGPETKWVFHTIADAVDFCDEQHTFGIEKVVVSKGEKVEMRSISISDWKEIKKMVKRLSAIVLR